MKHESRWPIAASAVATAALVAAFVFAPAALLRGSHPRYAEHSNLIADVNTAVVEYWGGGTSALTGELVDYWFQWHAIKIVISLLLIVALGLLAASLWRRSMASGAVGYVIAAMSATVLGLLSIFVLIANIQSTVVPLVALLPMVSSDNADPALARALTDMSVAVRSGTASPALFTLVDSVARYNWVMIVMAAPLSVIFGAASVVSFRRIRTTSVGDRLMYVLFTGAGVVMTAALLFLLVAAIVAVADPSTALLDVLGV